MLSGWMKYSFTDLYLLGLAKGSGTSVKHFSVLVLRALLVLFVCGVKVKYISFGLVWAALWWPLAAECICVNVFCALINREHCVVAPYLSQQQGHSRCHLTAAWSQYKFTRRRSLKLIVVLRHNTWLHFT